MNIAEAKSIPIQKLVEHLGGWYSHTDRKGYLWYHSPFRPEEKTASFKIDEKKNTWHDFGLSSTFAHKFQGAGGDILDLYCDYYVINRQDGVKQALQGLERFSHLAIRGERLHQQQRKEYPAVQNQQPTFKILKFADRITHYGLKEELQRRKISIEVANHHLKQGHILNTKTQAKYYSFLFENDKGGYELSIPNPKGGESFKSCIGPKGITYMKPSQDSSTGEVFEGFWDALSWLEIKKIKKPIHHTFCLNSNTLANEAVVKLIRFKDQLKFVLLFLDNDTSGFQTTHAMVAALEEHDFIVGTMEGIYKDFKDVSDKQMKF